MATPIEVMTKTFKEKTFDSRFDGTFAYQFRGNWELSGANSDANGNANVAYNANMLPINAEDSVLTFIDDDAILGSIVYPIKGAINAAGDGTSAAETL